MDTNKKTTPQISHNTSTEDVQIKLDPFINRIYYRNKNWIHCTSLQKHNS